MQTIKERHTPDGACATTRPLKRAPLRVNPAAWAGGSYEEFPFSRTALGYRGGLRSGGKVSTRRTICMVVLGMTLGTAAWAKSLTLTASDGAKVAASTEGSGTLGVVLVAGPGADLGSWSAVSGGFARNGARTVVVAPRTLEPVDGAEPVAVADVKAAVAWLSAQGAKTVTCVGAVEGGNLCVHVAAVEPSVARVAMISPRLSAPGLSITADLAALGDRPLLLVTSTSDATGTRAAAAIGKKAQGAAAPVEVEFDGDGPALFARAPTLESTTLAWLRADRTADQAAGPKMGEIKDIETTGTKYGE